MTVVAPPALTNATLNVQTELAPVTGFGVAVAVTLDAVPEVELTVTVVIPVELLKPDAPPYVAVIVSVPTTSDVPATVMLAVPLLRVAEPRDVDPEVNVTVPVGVVVPDAGRTVAVNTVEAFCAKLAGLADTAVVVATVVVLVTVTLAVPVDPLNDDEPP